MRNTRIHIVGACEPSADGKTLRSVYWMIGKESEKFIEVSDRQ
jgi:hypothetical protein